MAKSFPHSHVAHGKLVGYSLKKVKNEPTYTMFHRTPDGRRAKRDTNCTAMERAQYPQRRRYWMRLARRRRRLP